MVCQALEGDVPRAAALARQLWPGHTAGELERVQAALESITNQFCAQDERLDKMVQACVGEHKAPEPLPLEEKQQKKKG